MGVEFGLMMLRMIDRMLTNDSFERIPEHVEPDCQQIYVICIENP